MPGSGPMDWQPPQPPVRFPLREALMSFQDTAPPSPRSALASASASLERTGPLVAKSTQKSRALRQVGRQRRQGIGWSGEEALVRTPRPPPECDRPKPAPKVVQAFVKEGNDVKAQPPLVSRTRQAALRGAEDAGGATWPIMEESKSAPNLTTGSSSSRAGDGPPGARDTWTSAARAVLAHSRRFGGPSKTGQRSGGDGGDSPHGGSQTWYGPSPQSCRGLPRPVRDWAARGLEFTDSGLGIGPRFEQELRENSRRSPGPIYEQQSFGSVSRWSSDSTLPTKQPCGRHFSTEAHRIGVRRDLSKKAERQQPGPGTYELQGFAEELLHKLAKHPKGNTSGTSGAPAGVSLLAEKSATAGHL